MFFIHYSGTKREMFFFYISYVGHYLKLVSWFDM